MQSDKSIPLQLEIGQALDDNLVILFLTSSEKHRL